MERVLSQPRPSPFLTPAFLQPWVSSFAGPIRVGVWQDRGLILLHRSPTCWELLGGQDVADRLDGLGQGDEFWSSLRQQTSSWDAPLAFPNLGPDAWALESRQPQDQLETTDQSPWVSLAGDYEGYLASLGKKRKHELTRKMRRAERLSQKSLRVTHDLSDLEVFLRLHRLSSPAKADFMQSSMEDFFRQLCVSLDRAGMLWLRTLWDGSLALASVIQIRFESVIYLYNSGYDPEHAALAPGMVLLGWCLREASRQHFREYDFLRGTERYKYDLGGQDRPVYRLVWQ